jgi:hypothetical protein
MGTIADQTLHESDRVQAARARLERLRKEQGVTEFDLKKLLEHTVRSDEPDDELLAFLREIRSDGATQP